MSICADFLNKKAVMQPQIETKIGKEVKFTPKCHADISGWRGGLNIYSGHIKTCD